MENVCNMPTIAKIDIHKSKETGRYYAEFIQFRECNDSSKCGVWTEKRITKKMVQEILDMVNGGDGE